MDTCGGQGDDHVTRGHEGVVDDGGLVHQAHGEPGQVEVIGRHGARVLGGLPADEGASGLHAAFRHAAHQGGHLHRVVLADGDVVQEEQGPGAAAHHVVDAHGHAVDAHGIEPAHELGDALLGAHAVGAAHQHRLGHARRGLSQGEQSPETADIADHPGDHRALHVVPHEADTFVSRLDVNARFRIGFRIGFRHERRPFPKSSNCELQGAPRCQGAP